MRKIIIAIILVICMSVNTFASVNKWSNDYLNNYDSSQFYYAYSIDKFKDEIYERPYIVNYRKAIYENKALRHYDSESEVTTAVKMYTNSDATYFIISSYYITAHSKVNNSSYNISIKWNDTVYDYPYPISPDLEDGWLILSNETTPELYDTLLILLASGSTFKMRIAENDSLALEHVIEYTPTNFAEAYNLVFGEK